MESSGQAQTGGGLLTGTFEILDISSTALTIRITDSKDFRSVDPNGTYRLSLCPG